MKKLNLLKPKLKSIYLEDGKGESVKYLYIPKKLDKKALGEGKTKQQARDISRQKGKK